MAHSYAEGEASITSDSSTSSIVISGSNAGDAAGQSVKSAGDVNNDGFDDLLIGAAAADPSGRTDAGSAYVIFGGSTFSASIDLASLTGMNGFELAGAAAGDEFGFSVSSAGDVNDDGFKDLIVGAPGAFPNGQSQAGSAYVVFGSATSSATTDVSTLNGTNGFRLDGVNDDDRN